MKRFLSLLLGALLLAACKESPKIRTGPMHKTETIVCGSEGPKEAVKYAFPDYWMKSAKMISHDSTFLGGVHYVFEVELVRYP